MGHGLMNARLIREVDDEMRDDSYIWMSDWVVESMVQGKGYVSSICISPDLSLVILEF
jgi:hypothetical protein